MNIPWRLAAWVVGMGSGRRNWISVQIGGPEDGGTSRNRGV
jgi:hypothetical protein